jgi:hypothetical protein
MNDVLEFIYELKKIKHSIHPNMTLQEQVMLKEDIDCVINTYNSVVDDYKDWGDQQALKYLD